MRTDREAETKETFGLLYYPKAMGTWTLACDCVYVGVGLVTCEPLKTCRPGLWTDCKRSVPTNVMSVLSILFISFFHRIITEFVKYIRGRSICP